MENDLISRQDAIDAIAGCTNCGDEEQLRKYVVKHGLENGWTGGVLDALDAIKDLPPAEQELIECDPVKACIEVTMNKLCSAYRYLSMLEDLKVYGYVLAKRREMRNDN